MATMNLPATPSQLIEYLRTAIKLTDDVQTKSYINMAVARIQKKIHKYELTNA